MTFLTFFIIGFIITTICGIKALTYFIVVPIIGFTFGGFGWALTAMVLPQVRSLEAFSLFVITVTIFTGVLIIKG